TDPSLSDDDTELGESAHQSILTAGAAYMATLNVRLPDGVSGPFYLLVFTDANVAGPIDSDEGVRGDGSGSMGRVPEFQGEGNNITAASLPVLRTPPPDLQVVSATAQGPDPGVPGHVFTGQSFTVTWTVADNGPGDTHNDQSAWDDQIWLSRDQFLSDADVYLATVRHTGRLPASASSTLSDTG